MGAEEHRRAAIAAAEQDAWAVGGQFVKAMSQWSQYIQRGAGLNAGERLGACADGLVHQRHYRPVHIADAERPPQNMSLQLRNLHLYKLAGAGVLSQFAQVNGEPMVCPVEAFVGKDWRRELEHSN